MIMAIRVLTAMRREATALKLRQNLGEFLNQVQYRGDSIVVTKDGKPVAALVDYALGVVARWLACAQSETRREQTSVAETPRDRSSAQMCGRNTCRNSSAA